MRTIIRNKSARGITLVECLVFMAIWAGVSVASLALVRESALMRGQARHRAELALVAQSELERVRALPAADLAAGDQVRPPAEWWPSGTSCTLSLAPMTASVWQITVQVGRNTVRDARPVTLATVRRGTQL